VATFACTDLASVKTMLESNIGATQDTLLGDLITAISGRIERHLHRGIGQESRTEYFDAWPGRTNRLQLHAYPVQASPAVAIKNDQDHGFGGGITALNDDLYTVDLERGVVYFENTTLLSGRRVLQVVYTGGLALTTVAALVAAAPEVEMAARGQVVTEFRRRTGGDAQSLSLGGGSEAYVGEVKLLDNVRAMLAPYVRGAVFS